MKYKNFLYLSKRYKAELNRNTLCELTPTLFSSYSLTRMSDFNNFTFLEKRFYDSIKELMKIKEEICCDNRVSQKTKKEGIYDVDMRIDFYKRCLILLDFYKKV